MIAVRKGNERGYADHGWLKSFHSFSFAEYQDPLHMAFGSLRVINEDRVAPGTGFATHAHRDMGIVSYVPEGALAHKDSMGNGSSIVPGDVQRMSAGTGVTHSEFNHEQDRETHFLQIWITPDTPGIAPGYEQRHFAATDKRGRLCLVASQHGRDGSVTIDQAARIFATLLNGAERVVHPMADGRRAYAYVVRGAVTVNGVELGAGDALKMTDVAGVEMSQGQDAEILLFDLV